MSKETDLDAKAAQLRDFIFQEIPSTATWNINVTRMREGLTLLGDFFSDTDTAIANLRALFEADHAVDGKNPVPSEWVPDGASPTYLGAGLFSLPGDRRADYLRGHRIRAALGPSTNVEVTAQLVGFDALANRTTITVAPPALTGALSAVSHGLVRFSVPRIVAGGIMPEAILGPELADGAVKSAAIADYNVFVRNIVVGAALPYHYPVAAAGPTPFGAGTEHTVLQLTVPATRGARALLVGTCFVNTGIGSAALRLRRHSPSPAELRLLTIPSAQAVLLLAVTSGVTEERVYRLTVTPTGAAATITNAYLDYLEFA